MARLALLLVLCTAAEKAGAKYVNVTCYAGKGSKKESWATDVCFDHCQIGVCRNKIDGRILSEERSCGFRRFYPNDQFPHNYDTVDGAACDKNSKGSIMRNCIHKLNAYMECYGCAGDLCNVELDHMRRNKEVRVAYYAGNNAALPGKLNSVAALAACFSLLVFRRREWF